MPVRSRPTREVILDKQRDSLSTIYNAYLDRRLTQPDILEFVFSDQYLNRQGLYPLQGTMLKVAFLQFDLLTEFDYEVIGRWSQQFTATGMHGCQPDLLERMEICRAEGRPWFREWLSIIGRRGSKGYLGGIAAAYVLWTYMLYSAPQAHFGIDSDKRLSMFVFASKKEYAVKNQWRDIYNVIAGSKCFQPYLAERPLKEELLIRSPNDLLRISDRDYIGGSPETTASFEVIPKESTVMAARGPAVFALFFDEFGHITTQHSKADSTELWSSATPALDTFGKEAFIYEGSSTWQMLGQFYENSRQALALSSGNDGLVEGTIMRPELLMFQLESWDPYKYWETAHLIPLRPGQKATYPRQKQAIIEYDDDMKRIERANPRTFGIERKSHWATVLDAYLQPERVDAMFELWPPHRPLNFEMTTTGRMNQDYYAHVDPSKSGANTALAIAHRLEIPGDPLPHVIFDYLDHWTPGQFEYNNYEIDYMAVLSELKVFIRAFMPNEFTFDQGYSAFMIQDLRQFVNHSRFPKSVQVFERTTTFASNWRVAESFKTAIGLGLVHIPGGSESAALLAQECKFLQMTKVNRVDHPTSGPIQTSDLFDAVSILVDVLIGRHLADLVGSSMMEVGISGSVQGGFPLANQFSQSEKPVVNEVAARMMAMRKAAAQSGKLPSPNPARGGRLQTVRPFPLNRPNRPSRRYY